MNDSTGGADYCTLRDPEGNILYQSPPLAAINAAKAKEVAKKLAEGKYFVGDDGEIYEIVSEHVVTEADHKRGE